MSRIIGVWCSNTTCSHEQHRLHLKDMFSWQNRTGCVTQSILVVFPGSVENHWPLSTSIIESGQPPVNDDTGRWSIVYDGILYNAAMLGEELHAKGQSRSATDAEIIMHA